MGGRGQQHAAAEGAQPGGGQALHGGGGCLLSAYHYVSCPRWPGGSPEGGWLSWASGPGGWVLGIMEIGYSAEAGHK